MNDPRFTQKLIDLCLYLIYLQFMFWLGKLTGPWLLAWLQTLLAAKP